MGFDDTLTKSLVASIRLHFDVLVVVGGFEIFTVADAINFARETLQARLDDKS
jgi:hypothetical protein